MRILVVEDEEIIRNIFRESIAGWGFTVESASNGKEALQLCKRKEFHIVITDLNMPLMDGMTLLKRIKKRWPFIEVIVITGYATIESAIEAMKIGATDFILKPVNFEQVKFTVEKSYQRIVAIQENKTLREANSRLKEINELKDKFLSITNHEIRTPLTVIKGYLEILEVLLENPSPEIQEVLETLNRSTLDLREAVERMHLLSRLNEGMPLSPPKTDLAEVASKVCEEMELMFRYRNIHFRYHLPHSPIPVLAEQRSIQLLFRELLQNALKFTPDYGSVELSITIESDEVHIRISDTGVGIPFEKQNLVFQEFYEVQEVEHHSTSDTNFMGGGLGIGLSLVKEVVTELHGNIQLTSELNRGTTFVVQIPIANLTSKETHHEHSTTMATDIR